MTPDARHGLSRIEVLVVAGCLGLLAAIVAPALLSSRESSRLGQCQNHFRELAIALHSYHDSHGTLPPAAVWSAAGRQSLALHFTDRIDQVTHANWAQLVLPYLGQPDLSGQFDWDRPVADDVNATARQTAIAVMTCPSDTYNRADNLYEFRVEGASQTVVRFARGNYAINGGSHNHRLLPGTPAAPVGDGPEVVMDRSRREFRYWGNGVAGFNRAFSFAEFTNGLASTVLLDEVRAGVHPVDPRGVWALGQVGGSITWAHGINGDAYGPNNLWGRSDDIVGCGELDRIIGRDRLVELGMPCCWYCRRNDQATARSLHPGGVNVALADGSARFVSDSVDPGLWHVMHSRETPAEVLAQRFDAFLEVENFPEQPRDERARALREPSEPLLQNSVGMQFVLLPGGEFTMAIPDDGNTHELPPECPPHQVRITRAFYLGQFEVTQAEYERVMGENPSWHSPAGGGADEVAGVDTGRFPVEEVTWYDAVEFCRQLSDLPDERAAGRVYRLPTEAEWEYACRSGQSVAYRWSKQRPPNDDSGENAGVVPPLPIAPVGSYRPNEFGLYDMRGNVWEWCADWFDRDYYARSPVEDPQGPADGFLKVVRGGDWAFTGEPCKINYPVTPPWKSSPFIGFRVVCELAAHE